MKPFAGKSIALWVEELDELAQLGSALVNLGFAVYTVDSAADARGLAGSGAVDLVLTSLSRTFTGPLELLSWIGDDEGAAGVVVAVDQWDKDLYLEALRRGAFDGVALPLDMPELERILERALAAPQLQRIA